MVDFSYLFRHSIRIGSVIFRKECNLTLRQIVGGILTIEKSLAVPQLESQSNSEGTSDFTATAWPVFID